MNCCNAFSYIRVFIWGRFFSNWCETGEETEGGDNRAKRVNLSTFSIALGCIVKSPPRTTFLSRPAYRHNSCSAYEELDLDRILKSLPLLKAKTHNHLSHQTFRPVSGHHNFRQQPPAKNPALAVFLQSSSWFQQRIVIESAKYWIHCLRMTWLNLVLSLLVQVCNYGSSALCVQWKRAGWGGRGEVEGIGRECGETLKSRHDRKRRKIIEMSLLFRIFLRF